MPLLAGRRGLLGVGLALLSVGPGCFEDSTAGATTDPTAGGSSGDPTQGADDDTGARVTTGESGGCASGCAADDGRCFSGRDDAACGFDGQQCIDCGPGGFCDEGTCEPLPLCTPENCAGCCDGDVCVSGLDRDACGQDGAQCSPCEGDSTCEDGVCEAPCETSCDGCCDASGDCIPLTDTTDVACGVDGTACAPCDDAFGCAEGVCISLECQANCGGCCIGDECLNGDSLQACGVDGAACQPCPSGTLCDGQCVPDEDALWQVFVESATTTNANTSGVSWDPFGVPDPYLELTFGPLTAQTSFVSDTTTPVWDELLFDGVTAAELLAEPGVYELWDDDFGNDESMGQCTFALAEDQFGIPLVADCTDEDDTLLWSVHFTIQAAR